MSVVLFLFQYFTTHCLASILYLSNWHNFIYTNIKGFNSFKYRQCFGVMDTQSLLLFLTYCDWTSALAWLSIEKVLENVLKPDWEILLWIHKMARSQANGKIITVYDSKCHGSSIRQMRFLVGRVGTATPVKVGNVSHIPQVKVIHTASNPDNKEAAGFKQTMQDRNCECKLSKSLNVLLYYATRFMIFVRPLIVLVHSCSRWKRIPMPFRAPHALLKHFVW